MITTSVEHLCEGLGHWSITVSDGVQVYTLEKDWNEIQVPLEAEELRLLAVLLLRAKFAGVPLEGLSDLLLSGVTV